MDTACDFALSGLEPLRYRFTTGLHPVFMYYAPLGLIIRP